MNLPSISVVMPVYNEEKNIERALQSIREQDYPQNKVEILLVDDNSTDKTVEIAKKFNVVYCKNGAHDYDKGKSIGIQKAKNDYIIFLDGDNFLTEKTWLRKIVKPLFEEKDVVGAQPIWFTYDKKHPLAERYCELFGITDPLTIYLKKRDRLMRYEKKWNLVKKYEEKEDYFIVTFKQDNLPTIGSVGFIIKKDLLKETQYAPKFSHLDCMMDLIKNGKNKFAMVKTDITHLHSSTVKSFLGKLNRNMDIFLRDNHERRYTWQTSKGRLAIATLQMLTGIVPLYHSIKGFIKIPDIAWFLHPYICFRVATMYITKILWNKGGINIILSHKLSKEKLNV